MMPDMTQSRLAAIAFRWSMTAVFALWVFAPSAPAQRAPSTAPVAKLSSINGVYNGTYAGDKGPIKFKLTLTQQREKENGPVNGAFTLYLPDGSSTKEYTCE